MKKTALICAVLLMLCCLCSCAAPVRTDSPEKLNIVSAIFPSYDFARQICGDLADISLLIPPGNEVHGYEPSLQDIALIAECDLFIYAGGESDSWTQDIITASGNTDITVLSMLELVDTYAEEHTEGMQDDHHHEHNEEEQDEHVWTSLHNAKHIAEAICSAVCSLDHKNAEQYKNNTEKFTAALDSLDQDYHKTLSSAEKNYLVFAERFPFRYLTEEYGLEYDAAFSGCSSDTEPSLTTIAYLIDQVKTHQANAVFYIEFSDTTIADMIADATGTKAMRLHSCQNVTTEDFNSGITYLQLMQQNLETLKEALNG